MKFPSLLAGLFWLSVVSTTLAQPAQIILLRHGEKPENPAELHLSPRGEQRAAALATLLAPGSALTSNAPIAALFATRTTQEGGGLRSQETLRPLAKSLGLSVATPFKSKDYRLLAHQILLGTGWRGKTVVICWNHEEIPDLAAALGLKPKPKRWKDKVFDRLWIIQPRDGSAELIDLPQRLLKGDSKH